jgi:hypothetical protein
MRPETIEFTGLSLTPEQAIRPRKRLVGLYPAEWIRHQWMVEYGADADLNRLDRYIERTLDGQWGSYSIQTVDGLKLVVLFEQVTDAVMFRLKGGEKAFIKPETEW